MTNITEKRLIDAGWRRTFSDGNVAYYSRDGVFVDSFYNIYRILYSGIGENISIKVKYMEQIELMCNTIMKIEGMNAK